MARVWLAISLLSLVGASAKLEEKRHQDDEANLETVKIEVTHVVADCGMRWVNDGVFIQE